MVERVNSLRFVNRSALLVRPREPFIEWAKSIDPEADHLAVSLRGETSVYLVAEDPAGEEESAPVEQYYEQVFELELENWCTDPERWPPHRDYAMFLQWFDVQANSMLVDLESVPLDWDDS